MIAIAKVQDVDERNSEQLICNPLRMKTWKRTGIVLVIIFGLAIGISFIIGKNNKQEQISINSSKAKFSNKGKEYEAMKEYYMTRYKVMYPIISTNFSDINDLILPSTPQYKALQWIVYKDTVIQLQEYSNRFLDSDITEDLSLSTTTKRFTIDDLNYQRLQQRYAAIVLFYSLCGETWRKTVDDLNDPVVAIHEVKAIHQYNVSECNFLGFQCSNYSDDSSNIGLIDPNVVDNNDHVLTSVDLEGYHLVGQIPSEIGLLTSLTSLNLARNFLVGTLPQSIFEKLTNLESLDLRDNQFYSTIPSAIGNLIRLKTLRLSENRLLYGGMPISLSSLSSLEMFDIHDNVNVADTSLETILSYFRRLKHIMIDNTRITGTIPTNLSSYVPDLTTFTIEDTQVRGTIPTEEFNTLTKLQKITIANNPSVEGLIPDLSKLRSLEFVYFQGRKLIGTLPEAMADISNLTEIGIRETSIGGRLPSDLGTLAKLREVDLGDNSFSGTIPNEWGNLPNIRSISVYNSYRSLTGTFPSGLCNRKQLQLFIPCSMKTTTCPATCFDDVAV